MLTHQSTSWLLNSSVDSAWLDSAQINAAENKLVLRIIRSPWGNVFNVQPGMAEVNSLSSFIVRLGKIQNLILASIENYDSNMSIGIVIVKFNL